MPYIRLFLFGDAKKDDPSQGDLGTLANVVTSLAHLTKSREASESGTDPLGVETLSNGDSSMTDIQGEDQTASDITRYVNVRRYQETFFTV